MAEVPRPVVRPGFVLVRNHYSLISTGTEGGTVKLGKMSLLGKATAGYSGNVQEAIGWFGFFLYAAALGIPAIILSIVVAARHDKLLAKAQ